MKAISVFVRRRRPPHGLASSHVAGNLLGAAAGVSLLIIKVFHPREAASLAVSFG